MEQALGFLGGRSAFSEDDRCIEMREGKAHDIAGGLAAASFSGFNVEEA